MKKVIMLKTKRRYARKPLSDTMKEEIVSELSNLALDLLEDKARIGAERARLVTHEIKDALYDVLNNSEYAN